LIAGYATCWIDRLVYFEAHVDADVAADVEVLALENKWIEKSNPASVDLFPEAVRLPGFEY
jgi:hypothetical protein